MAFIVFYITHPSQKHAQRISDELISKRYVACTNIYPMSSEYRWQGKVEKDEEWVSICKTSYDNIDNVEKLVGELHDYDVPCISHWEASANTEYEKWIFKNVLRR